MVNINNATQGGVSANYYKKLDVNQENLILNNYKGEAANTNLGGVIYGNPNMNGSNGRMADIILNEITSNQQTRIDGYIEVAGKKADVIIANPNGIMVSGGGFINTARLSMITGSSINPNTKNSLDANGNLNPFKLSTEPNAVINVVGKNITNERGDNIGFNIGIDAQNTDYLTLISRVVNVAGDIIGNSNTVVEIKTDNGKAIFNKQTGEFDVSSDDTITKGKPQFAFDSTAMGGIYAGKVSIIATEHGVGVRARGDVVAYVDDIEFDVNGNIKIEDGNLQTLNQKAQIKINNQNKSTAEKFDVEIDNSNIYGGNINIKTDNLIKLDEDGNQLFYKLDEYDNPILDSNDNPIPYAEYEVSLDDNGQPLKRILDPYTIKITEDDIDNDLAELHEKLGKPYNSDDWKIDITSFKNDLNNTENAQDLNEKLIQYNEEQEKKSPSLTPLTLEEYKTYLINEETKRQTTERLNRIKTLYDNINKILTPYINEDWSQLSDNDFRTKLSTLHSQQGINDASFNIKDWEIPELDTPSQPLDDYTTSLQKIRLDTDLDSVEQTRNP